MIKPEKLILAVAELAGCKYGEIIGKDRKRPLPFCRMMIAEYYTGQGLSNQEVGNILHKTHSVVQHYKHITPVWKEQLARCEQAVMNNWAKTLERLEEEQKQEDAKARFFSKKEEESDPEREKMDRELDTPSGRRLKTELSILYAIGDMIDSQIKTVDGIAPFAGFNITGQLRHAMNTLAFGGVLYRNQLAKEPKVQQTAISVCADAYLGIIRLIVDRAKEDIDLLKIYNLIEDSFPSYRHHDLAKSKEDLFYKIIQDYEEEHGKMQ